MALQKNYEANAVVELFFPSVSKCISFIVTDISTLPLSAGKFCFFQLCLDVTAGSF